MSESRLAPIPLGRIAEATGGELSSTGSERTEIRGVRQDSRQIEPGDLFVARSGQQADGLLFVPQAVARGACAIMVQREHAPADSPVPLLTVANVRLAMARAAALVYGAPSAHVQVVGITGTNGKTATAHLVQAALTAVGHRPGIMGTFGAHLGNLPFPTQHNTPEADDLCRILANMRAQGASHLVMEVTSHALAQQRVDAVRFQAAAFTNLTLDHLDLHGSFAAYGAAKSRLFVDLRPEVAAVMVDGDFGTALADRIVTPVLRVSFDPQAPAEVRPTSTSSCDAHGIRCEVATPAGRAQLCSPLLGRHNLENLLLALAICVGLDLDLTQSSAALSSCTTVPGRLERCDGVEDDISVFVDYAHTPDALDKALSAVRLLGSGRVHCVFGCGGDRDRSKRPLMGEVVGRLADVAIVTSDNPRSESPERIAAAIVEGLAPQPAQQHLELDRARAIEQAVGQADPGDVVVVAGKGHETRQLIGGRSYEFDDRTHARAALAARRHHSR